MSVTLYVENWNLQSGKKMKVYLADEFPDLDDEYFSSCGYDKDENGFYEERIVHDNPFPETQMSNANWHALFSELTLNKEVWADEILLAEIPGVIRKAMAFFNSNKRLKAASRPGTTIKNIIDGGISESYLHTRMQQLLDLLRFAQKKQLGVYWG